MKIALDHLLKVAFVVLQLSFADFMMYEFLDQLRTFEPLTLDPFQNIKDFMARIEVSKMKAQQLLRKILQLKITWFRDPVF